jgi:hypothetical protein
VGVKGGYNTPAYNIFIYHFEHYVYYLMLHENLHKKEGFGRALETVGFLIGKRFGRALETVGFLIGKGSENRRFSD